jgi:hypothetical protein
MSETRTPRLAVSPELQKARDGIEILRDMILATAHGQTHREAMHAAILDIAPFLEERSEPAAASVPLLIDQLADRLEDWAQNEEMIDQFFLGHGKDCNEAAKLLRALSSAPGERT